MKTILTGLILILAGIIEMVFVHDATVFVFFAPFGAYLIVMGFKHGNKVLTEEFWED